MVNDLIVEAKGDIKLLSSSKRNGKLKRPDNINVEFLSEFLHVIMQNKWLASFEWLLKQSKLERSELNKIFLAILIKRLAYYGWTDEAVYEFYKDNKQLRNNLLGAAFYCYEPLAIYLVEKRHFK